MINRYMGLVLALFAATAAPAAAVPITTMAPGNALRVVVLRGIVYGTIAGQHQPLKGASVELEDPSAAPPQRIVSSVVTDASGQYAMTNPARDESSQPYYDVPPGSYVLYASYYTTRVSMGSVTLTSSATVTRNLEMGPIARAGGGAPPPPVSAFFATDRLEAAGARTVQTIFENQRLIDPCMPSPACEMTYGMVATNGPFFVTPITATDVSALLVLIRKTPAYAQASSMLIFIHGYNNDFFSPFQLGATWLASFDPAEPIIVYSWPSNHVTAKYFDDETNITWDQWS